MDARDAADPLRDLLDDELGAGRYAVFFASGEGDVMPDGTEESSGFAVTEDDRHYFFWTGWDAAANRIDFSTWQPTVAEPSWSGSAEYRDARREVGLP